MSSRCSKRPPEVHDTLADYLSQPGLKLPAGLSLGLAAGSVFQHTFSQSIAGQIESMAQQFIAGRDLADALPLPLRESWSLSIDVFARPPGRSLPQPGRGRRVSAAATST